jgi:hypothetical protein
MDIIYVIHFLLLGWGIWLFFGSLFAKERFQQIYSRGGRFNFYRLMKNPVYARFSYMIIGLLITGFSLWIILSNYFHKIV